MKFTQKIFREYDIRGVYGKDYNADFAGLLARAIAQYFREHHKTVNDRPNFKIAIGRDARLSGDEITPRFKNAFIEEGFDVVDLGIVPTPLVYFATFNLDVDGAICITGSHNPPEYNGFKICMGTSTLHGHDIQELYKLCLKLQKEGPSSKPPGKLAKKDIIAPYKEYVKKTVSLGRKLKIVVDPGNGAGCVVAPELLEQLGCEVIPLFCELDGTFPNHHPDPTVLENLKDLQEAVLKHKADVGIAYDGDADRIGAVDEKGRAIFGDELMVLYSREILSRKKGATILSEVKCSTRLYQDIEKNGGRAVMWKTGHSLIKAKMREEGAELAGEMSGHMFFQDRYFGFDDAVYASVRLLEILSHQRKPLSQLLSDLPPAVSTPEIRVDCDDDLKFPVVERVKNILAKNFKTIDIDGVRIETPEGWGLLRASNTQPVVVMRFEAQTQAQLDKIRKTVEDAFEDAKRTLMH